MIKGKREAIASHIFFVLMFPAVLFAGCAMDENESGGTGVAIQDNLAEVSSAGDFLSEGKDSDTSEGAAKEVNLEDFLGVDGMTQTELDIEDFWAANDVDNLIEKYNSIEIVSSCYEDGAALPLYTNNYWYSNEYRANMNEPGDAYIIKDGVRVVSRPDYMSSDNKEETGVMIELYSSPDSRIENVVENIYAKKDENLIKRCLQGDGEVYIEAEKEMVYPNEDELENKELQEKTTKWCMVFDEGTKELKRAAISSTNILGGVIDTRYYTVTLGSEMPEKYWALKKTLDDNLAASDEDSRNVHFVYGAGNSTKKEGDFKVKKGTNVIFETSKGNLFLDADGTIPYDSSDLTSDITVYRLKK